MQRFLDVTPDFARQCEYQADAESARLCGADTAAQALITLTVQRRALADYFWPALYRRGRVEPLLPLHELAGEGLLEAPVDAAQARSWLHETSSPTTPPRPPTGATRTARFCSMSTMVRRWCSSGTATASKPPAS